MADADTNKNEKSPEVAMSEKKQQQVQRNIELAKTIGKQYGDAFKKSFDPSLINHDQVNAFMNGSALDIDTPYYTQKINDDLELWCGGLKVKAPKEETIECMPC